MQFDAAEISPCLDVGSSTLHFRTVQQPHIDRAVFAPLRERGVKVLHSDLKQAEGVDIAGDIFDPAVQSRLCAVGARLVLCCAIFEHVRDPAVFARAVAGLVPPGGRLLVTVPRSYPYHPDPIDTYFRPMPEEIAALFEGFAIEHAGIITGGTYLDRLRQGGAWAAARRVLWSLTPTRRPAMWLARAHPLLWLVRPYRVSYVLLTRPRAAAV